MEQNTVDDSEGKTASGLPKPMETRMGPVDKCLWWVEKDVQPMTIGNIWEMDGDLDIDNALKMFLPLFNSKEYRRYRQIGVEHSGNAYWVDYPDFNARDHIFAHQLPSPGSRKEMEDLVSRLFTERLDHNKPLWQCDLINGCEGGGTVLIFRAHHSLTDGQGSIRALLSVMHAEDGVDISSLQYMAAPQKPPEQPSAKTNKEKFIYGAKRVGWFLLAICMLVYQSIMFLWFVIKFVWRPKISFYRPISQMEREKRVSWSRGLDLDQVKFVKNTFKTSLNDVLVSCVTMALRSHLVDNALQVQEPMCGIPVSMRCPDDWEMKNESTMIYTYLPTLVKDREDCLREVNRRMLQLKGSVNRYYTHYSVKLLYSIPYINRLIYCWDRKPMDWLCSRVGCVLTNVPGPQVPLVFGQIKVKSYVPFIPLHGAGAVGMGIMSYAGKVHFGVLAEDGYLAGGPRDIVDRFENEFQQLYILAAKKLAAQQLKEKED